MLISLTSLFFNLDLWLCYCASVVVSMPPGSWNGSVSFFAAGV